MAAQKERDVAKELAAASERERELAKELADALKHELEVFSARFEDLQKERDSLLRLSETLKGDMYLTYHYALFI